MKKSEKMRESRVHHKITLPPREYSSCVMERQTYDIKAQIVKGSVLHLICQFSPLNELPVRKIACIYVLDKKEDRQLMFRKIAGKFLENANPWVDLIFETRKIENEIPRRCGNLVVRLERDKIDEIFESKFEKLERDVLQGLAHKSGSHRHRRSLYEVIDIIRSIRQRKSLDDANSGYMSSGSTQFKLPDKDNLKPRSLRSKSFAYIFKNKNWRMLPENFNIFKHITFDEFINIFGKKTFEERWFNFRKTVLSKYEDYEQKRSLQDPSRREFNEHIFNNEVRVIFDCLHSEFLSAMGGKGFDRILCNPQRYQKRLTNFVNRMMRAADFPSAKPRRTSEGGKRVRKQSSRERKLPMKTSDAHKMAPDHPISLQTAEKLPPLVQKKKRQSRSRGSSIVNPSNSSRDSGFISPDSIRLSGSDKIYLKQVISSNSNRDKYTGSLPPIKGNDRNVV